MIGSTWLRDEIVQRGLIHQRPTLIFDLDDVAARLDDAKARFAELRYLGIDLCLNRFDDSPLASQMLGQLPIALVRLRQSALDEMNNARLTQLVDAAHQHGAALIATGIENPQAIARAWSCGVDFVQGNFVQPANIGFDFDFEEAGLV